MEAKANELRTLLSQDDWPYLAQHLVINRASIEPNFHSLYLEFLDQLQAPGLLDLVLSATYAGIMIVFGIPSESLHFSAQQFKLY